MVLCKAFSTCSTGRWADTAAIGNPNLSRKTNQNITPKWTPQSVLSYLKRVFCAAPGSVMSFSWLKRTDMILETKLKRRTSRSAWMKSRRRKASASALKPATSFVDFTVIWNYGAHAV